MPCFASQVCFMCSDIQFGFLFIKIPISWYAADSPSPEVRRLTGSHTNPYNQTTAPTDNQTPLACETELLCSLAPSFRSSILVTVLWERQTFPAHTARWYQNTRAHRAQRQFNPTCSIGAEKWLQILPGVLVMQTFTHRGGAALKGEISKELVGIWFCSELKEDFRNL